MKTMFMFQVVAEFPGTLREHGASQSRTRRTSFGTNLITIASRLRRRQQSVGYRFTR